VLVLPGGENFDMRPADVNNQDIQTTSSFCASLLDVTTPIWSFQYLMNVFHNFPIPDRKAKPAALSVDRSLSMVEKNF
jgi:hypothetical protein